jgi:hypothetical protein
MKTLAIIVASCWLATAAMAQSPTTPPAAPPAAPAAAPTDAPAVTAGKACQDKNATVHGAALTSHIKSCCHTAATGKKLHGAAATTFEKSCQHTALGT